MGLLKGLGQISGEFDEKCGSNQALHEVFAAFFLESELRSIYRGICYLGGIIDTCDFPTLVKKTHIRLKATRAIESHRTT